jgi:6-phosphogluconolactonase (cycloisomerase 2 family)
MQRLVAQFLAVFFAVVVCALHSGAAAASDTGFVYALQDVSGAPNAIWGYRLDSKSGALTLLPGFPKASGGNGNGSTLSEGVAFGGGRLYVLNAGSATVSVFTVDQTTGALSALPYSPIALGAGVSPTCVAVPRSGSPVVVGDGLADRLFSFVVTSVSATAAAGSPFATTSSATPFSCHFSQDGSHVYTGGDSGSSIAGFSVDSGTGVLTPLAGSPFDSGSPFPAAYADDNGSLLFIANFTAGQVRAFTLPGGIPTAVSGNPFPSGLTNATHGLLHPAGFYMVADRVGNRVGVYRVSGIDSSTTLSAVVGSPFSTFGTFTDALALSEDGNMLVAANGSSRNLTTMRVDSGTGALTPLFLQPADTLGSSGTIIGLGFVPRAAGFVYALREVNGGANQIYGFQVDPITATLSLLPGFPMSSGGNGTALDASEQLAYANGRLFVLNDGSDTVTVFSVNRSSGALTAAPFSPISIGAGTWLCVAASPSASDVVAGAGEGSAVSFALTASTATPAPGNPYSLGGFGAFSCGFSRGGNYVYVGGNSGTKFAGFGVDAGSAALTALSGSPYDSGGTSPVGYATDSSNRLFAANAIGSQLRAFTTSAGVPSPVSGNPFTSGLTLAIRGILHPFGYYIVADRTDTRIGIYRISGSGSGTTLSAVAGSGVGTGGSETNGIAVTPDGGVLIAANGTSRNLTMYRVDPATGTPTFVSVQGTNTLGPSGEITGLAFAPGAMPAFTDDPLTGSGGFGGLGTVIRAAHIAELRSRIDALRSAYGLSAYSYTNAILVPMSTEAKTSHVAELRLALQDVYDAAGRTRPIYTDPTLAATTTVIKAVHINELRAAVLAIE